VSEVDLPGGSGVVSRFGPYWWKDGVRLGRDAEPVGRRMLWKANKSVSREEGRPDKKNRDGKRCRGSNAP